MAPDSIFRQTAFDFFTAHSHKDKVIARDLYDHIVSNGFTAFLDKVSLIPGSAWDEEIPRAQQSSGITDALISGNIQQAWFAREEVQAAIDMVRVNPGCCSAERNSNLIQRTNLRKFLSC